MTDSTLRSSSRLAFHLTVAGALVLGVLAYAWWAWPGVESQPSKFKAVDITGVEWGKNFELMDFNGKHRTLADFRGKLVLLFFGYRSCPDMCPTTMAKLGQVMRLLEADANADQVQGLFITIDPKRDFAQVQAKYVPAFYSAFLGLSGTEQQTAAAAKEFKVYFQAQKPANSGFYSVDHSGPLYVVDQRGLMRLFVEPEIDAALIARDLRALLKKSAT